MEKTLRVKGKGNISVKPDLIRIRMSLTETKKDYEKAVKASAEAIEAVKAALGKLGFAKEDVKTVSYNIEESYENYRDKNDTWKRRFLGYTYEHQAKIEFAADNEMLGKVLYAIAHCEARPEFHIEYTVADAETAKDQLLANAIADSMRKAKVLAKAAEMELGEIQSIDYSWGEIDLLYRPFAEDMVMDAKMNMCNTIEAPGAFDMDIEPDDIKASDTVTVVWNLK